MYRSVKVGLRSRLTKEREFMCECVLLKKGEKVHHQGVDDMKSRFSFSNTTKDKVGLTGKK